MPLFVAARQPGWRSLRGLAVAAAVFAAACTSARAEGDEVIDLRFGQFFRQPVGPRGLEMEPGLLAADGRRVRIVGYMVAREHIAGGGFLLTARPVRMSEEADGDADDLPPATVSVMLPEAQRQRLVAYRPGLVSVTGRLHVGRSEDASGRVAWVNLSLDPQEVVAAAPPTAEPAALPALP